MATWEVKKLGDVCAFVRGPFGGSLKKSCFKPSGFAVYEQQHAINNQFDDIRYYIDKTKFDEMKRFELTYGDLIMSCSGTMGKIAVVPKNIPIGIINQALLKLTPDTELNIDFLKIWMQSIDFQNQLNKKSKGVAIKNVASVKNLKEINIPIPPLLIQKQIVSILDKAFEKISKAKESAEKNLKNAKEIFESYLQSIFENKGEGWEEKTLEDICSFVRGPFGGSLKKNIFKPEGYAVYEQKHAIYNQFEDIRYFIDEKKFNEMKRFELKTGDLIMSCSGTMGKMAIVPRITKKGIINQALLKLTPSKKISVVFLKLWMQSESFQDSLKAYSQGAAIQNVASVKTLKKIKVPVPSLSEQQSIVSKLDALSQETKKLEAIYTQKLADLEELKKSILAKAFNGELTSKV